MVVSNIHGRCRAEMRLFFGAVCVALVIILCIAGALYSYAGMYGINVVLRRGGSIWLASGPNDPRISPAMKLALSEANPTVTAGDLTWREIRPGFQVS